MPLRAGLMAVGALLVTVCQLGCSSGVEGPDPDAQGSELQLSGDLVYTLDWDRTGVVFGEGSWSASNELGFEFEIDQAYAVTYSLELVPCDPVPDLDAGIGDMASWLLEWLGSRRAHAGHSGSPFNPTRLGQSMVESVHEARAYVSPVMSSQDVAYCQFHYLVARAHGGTQRLPDAYDLMGQSAAFAGRWRRGPGAWSDFEWRTNLPWGEVISLDRVDVPGAEFESNAMTRVRLQRPLRGLLKSLDPESMSPTVLANIMVKQLVQGTEVQIETPQGVWRSPP